MDVKTKLISQIGREARKVNKGLESNRLETLLRNIRAMINEYFKD